MDIKAISVAAEYIGTLDNMSGQMCQMKDGKPSLLLFDFGCPNCSEVQSRNADEWGDALALLVNSVPGLMSEIARLRAALAGLIGAESEDELKAMEALMRHVPAPAADKAAMLDAIHALLSF